MTVDGRGEVYVSDTKLHLIFKIRPDGFVEHVAGGGPDACRYDRWKTLQKPGYLDGPGKTALFNEPHGLALERDGSLLVADEKNCALRRISPDGSVSTVRKGCASNETNFPEPGEQLVYTWVAVDKEGLPVVAGSRLSKMDIYANAHRIHPDEQVERLLAGRKLKPRPGQPMVTYLSGFHILTNGTILITDGAEESDVLRELRGGKLKIYVGKLGLNNDHIDHDGPASQALLHDPGEWCASSDGTIFILPRHSWRPVHRIDPITRAVTTWVY
jgi:hypothetical protein